MRKAGPLLFVVLLLGLAALLLLAPWQSGAYDRSALGVKGLEVWLQAKGIPVVRSDAHVARAPSELSMRILPLRDPRYAPAGGDEEEDSAEGRFAPDILVDKLYELPTLVILPKWREGILKEGIAQQAMLVPPGGIYRDLEQIYLPDLRLKRLGANFEEAGVSLAPDGPQELALYSAQLFDRASLPENCAEAAGVTAGALVLRCEDDFTVYLLSDPDLLNNHGLARGENAALALSLIRSLRGAGETLPVYLDTDPRLLDEDTADDEGRTYERSASDLKRLFDYPLTLIWGAILLLTMISFWRGAYRFGPPLETRASDAGISKTVAVEAMARLLRLSGNDGRMAAQFVEHFLADKAALVFGPTANNQAGVERLFQRLSRRDETGANALRSTSQALIDKGPNMRRAELHHHLETFRTLLKGTDLGS